MLGGLLGGKGGSTTSKQTVEVPSWLDTKNQSLATRAEAASNTPFKAYTGQRVFDFSPDTLNAFQATRNNQGRYQPLLNQSSSLLGQLAQRSQGPTQAQITERMNPFLANVLDASRRRTIESYRGEQDKLAQNKALAGSFGGSRFAVREAENQRNLLNTLGDEQYRGLFDAFNSAQNQFGRENETMGQTASQYAQLAGQSQNIDNTDVNNLLQIGNAQQVRNQGQLDINYEDFDKEQAYPYEQVNFLSNILNPLTGAYRSQTQTNSSKEGGGSKLGQAIGIAANVASIFSDERLKTDIEKVGELDNGLPIYSFRYKDGGPQQIGLLAQEVEEVNPEAVTEDPSGFKKVNYKMATEEMGNDEEYGTDGEVEGYAEGGEVKATRERDAKRLVGTNMAPLSSLTQPGGGSDSSGGGMGGMGSLSGLSKLWGGGGATENMFGSPVTNVFDEGSGQWSSFTGSGAGLDFADFGSAGSSIGSFFGFNEGGGVMQKIIRDKLTGEPLPPANTKLAGPVPALFAGLQQNQDPNNMEAITQGRQYEEGATPGIGMEATQKIVADAFKNGYTPSSPSEVTPAVQTPMNTAPQLPTKGNTNMYDDIGLTAEGKAPNTNPAMFFGGASMGSLPQGQPSYDMPTQAQMDANITTSRDAPQGQGSDENWLTSLFGGRDNLRAFGTAMLTNKGDFFEQLGAGFQASAALKEAQAIKAQEAQQDLIKMKQQEFDNQLALLKTKAYVNQVEASTRKSSSGGGSGENPTKSLIDQLKAEELRIKNERERIKLNQEITTGVPLSSSGSTASATFDNLLAEALSSATPPE